MKKFIWTAAFLAIGCNGPIYNTNAPTETSALIVSPAPTKVIITAPSLLYPSGQSNLFSVQATGVDHHPCFNQKVTWFSPDGIFSAQDYMTDETGSQKVAFRLYQTLFLIGVPPASITATVGGISQTILVQITGGVAP